MVIDERMQKAEKMLRTAFEKHGVMDIDVDYGQMYHAVIVDVLLKDGWRFTARVETSNPDNEEERALEDEMVGFVIRHGNEDIYEGVDRLADFGKHVDDFLDPLTSSKSVEKLFWEDFEKRTPPLPGIRRLNAIGFYRSGEGERAQWIGTHNAGELLDLRCGLLDLLFALKGKMPENRVAKAICSTIYLFDGPADNGSVIENINDLCVLLKVIEDYESK